MQDVTFHSVSLDRDMPYRVVLPVSVSTDRRLPVVYLLHGGGGGYRDWTNYSDVARFAKSDFILVMPEGNSSYYMNALERPKDQYEEYITKDLVDDVESRFPAAIGRSNRAIIGVSMDGFGAVVLSFKHSDLYAFAGGLSSALDVPSRPFSIKRIGQYRGMPRFSDHGAATRAARMILIYSRRSLIRRKRHICILLAESRRACFLQTGDSRLFLRSTRSIMSFTPAQVGMIGISGTGDCRVF